MWQNLCVILAILAATVSVPSAPPETLEDSIASQYNDLINRAFNRYCKTATPMSCALYKDRIFRSGCLPLASQVPLVYNRVLLDKSEGLTQSQLMDDIENIYDGDERYAEVAVSIEKAIAAGHPVNQAALAHRVLVTCLGSVE